MDKKFDIAFLDKSVPKFLEYLQNKIDSETNEFLDRISNSCEVLIFSGVIRNYFINYKGALRDLDIVVSCSNNKFIEEELSKFNFEYKKNSFGGYKVKLSNLSLDLWEIKKTWALINHKTDSELFDDYNLPNTAFFNFSAIVFNINEKKFIASSSFLNFLETKEIDLVLQANPLPQLCIVNTIHYKVKYRLAVSENLKRYYLEHFFNYNDEEYKSIQKKHFKEVLYPYNYLKVCYKFFEEEIGATGKSNN